MGRVRRPRMSAREKVELWKRWKRGESLSDIGRALGRIPGAVHHVVSARGGIPPPSRTRSQRSLTLTEREEISRGLARGYSVRQIGVRLSRAPSTISREVRRNGGRRQYRVSVADARAWDRTRRPKPCRLALSPLLRALVAEKLAATGPHSRSPGGSNGPFRRILVCTCRTRRSISVSSCRVAGC